NEHVWAAFPSDETEPLLGVEELDGASGHCISLPFSAIGSIAEQWRVLRTPMDPSHRTQSTWDQVRRSAARGRSKPAPRTTTAPPRARADRSRPAAQTPGTADRRVANGSAVRVVAQSATTRCSLSCQPKLRE